MVWPADSPDLNLIEHAWNALARSISMSQPPPRIILELKIALVEEWEGLPQALLNSLNNIVHNDMESHPVEPHAAPMGYKGIRKQFLKYLL